MIDTFKSETQIKDIDRFIQPYNVRREKENKSARPKYKHAIPQHTLNVRDIVVQRKDNDTVIMYPDLTGKHDIEPTMRLAHRNYSRRQVGLIFFKSMKISYDHSNL